MAGFQLLCRNALIACCAALALFALPAAAQPEPAAPQSMCLEPTGDALFDWYAQLVAERLVELEAQHADLQTYSGAVLPAVETLNESQGQFGGEARFWQLYYLCDLAGLDEASAGAEEADRFKQSCFQDLKQAVDYFPPDGDSYLLLFRIASRLHRLHNIRDSHYGKFPEEVRQQFWAQEDEQLTQHEFELLEQAIAADSEEAWGYYERAFLHLSLGELEEGIADLAAGNRAPKIHYPKLFPYSVMAQRLRCGEATGSPELTSMLLLGPESQHVPYFIPMKEEAKNAQVIASLSGDQRLLDELYYFGCRLPEASPDQDLFALMGVVFISMKTTYMLENYAAELTSEQVRLLRCIRGACIYLRTKLQTTAGDQNAPFAELHMPAVELTLSGHSRERFDSALRQLELYNCELKPVFDKLRQVNFAADYLPAGLEIYEPYLVQYERDTAAQPDADQN